MNWYVTLEKDSFPRLGRYYAIRLNDADGLRYTQGIKYDDENEADDAARDLNFMMDTLNR